MTNNILGYLGKKVNKKIDNWMYGLGGLNNLSDLLMGFKNQDNIDLVTEHSDAVGHSEIVNKNNEPIVSVGPDRINPGAKESWHWMKGTNSWPSYAGGTSNHPIWRQTLRANTKMIDKYGAWLNKLENNGSLIYSLELSSCVTHTSMALNMSWIFNIGIHPYILNAQMYLRNLGIRPGLFLNYYHLNY